jgi:hypothetical protein
MLAVVWPRSGWAEHHATQGPVFNRPNSFLRSPVVLPLVVNNVSACLLRWPEEADVDGDFLLDGDRKCNRCYPTALPSTVQASIAFTSVAGGNVPAALCSASASNLLGVFLTPLIAGFLLAGHGVDISARSVFAVVVQLLPPFVAGQLMWCSLLSQRWCSISFNSWSARRSHGITHRAGPRRLNTLRVFQPRPSEHSGISQNRSCPEA